MIMTVLKNPEQRPRLVAESQEYSKAAVQRLPLINGVPRPTVQLFANSSDPSVSLSFFRIILTLETAPRRTTVGEAWVVLVDCEGRDDTIQILADTILYSHPLARGKRLHSLVIGLKLMMAKSWSEEIYCYPRLQTSGPVPFEDRCEQLGFEPAPVASLPQIIARPGRVHAVNNGGNVTYVSGNPVVYKFNEDKGLLLLRRAARLLEVDAKLGGQQGHPALPFESRISTLNEEYRRVLQKLYGRTPFKSHGCIKPEGKLGRHPHQRRKSGPAAS